MPDGRLLLVYRHGTSHVDDSGRIVAREGSADGHTWSAPRVLVDTPDIDDRDPSLAVRSNGEVLLTWFPYQRHALEAGTLVLHQVFAARSLDGGHTFGEAIQVSGGPMSPESARLGDSSWLAQGGDPLRVAACSSPAVELGATPVVPAYVGRAVDLDNLGGAPRSRIALLRNEDGGWREDLVLPNAWPEVWLQEPSLLPLDDGRLLLHIRTARGESPSSPGPLAQAIGREGVWTGWEDLGLVGHAPDLLQLDDGTILSAIREVDDAFTTARVSVLWSTDRAASWSEPLRLLECGEAECGYPSLLALEKGRVLVAWYGRGGRSIEMAVLQVR
ncbi:MAG: exo-alpha-sialidase [Deltaproteobacteria bacterium]|nr:exo-alpha-sialidase [Deltaproteobacteria bacterium]